MRASTPSATRCRIGGALGRRQSRAQAGERRRCAAATAASTSACPPRLTWAITLPSSGETSSNVLGARDALPADPVPGVDLDARDDCCGHRAVPP